MQGSATRDSIATAAKRLPQQTVMLCGIA
jgi:hypothetical protein